MLIVGGGPAGLAAAVWCSELGLRGTVLEREKITGGQLNWTFNTIRNFLGFGQIEPAELRERLGQQAGASCTEITTSVDVKAVDLAAKRIETEDGRVFTGRSIVVATGVRRRSLGIPGEQEFIGRGVLGSGAKSLDQTEGKRVVVVGGGDAAAENAVMLAKRARSITLVHRRENFTARKIFMDQIAELKNIDVRTSCRLSSIDGTEHVETVTISGPGAEYHRINADLVLIRVGVMPNSEAFASQLELDDSGYIKVDAHGSTQVDLVYAVGDVANPISPTLNSAIGMGVTAAKHLVQRLT